MKCHLHQLNSHPRKRHPGAWGLNLSAQGPGWGLPQRREGRAPQQPNTTAEIKDTRWLPPCGRMGELLLNLSLPPPTPTWDGGVRLRPAEQEKLRPTGGKLEPGCLPGLGAGTVYAQALLKRGCSYDNCSLAPWWGPSAARFSN